MSHPEMILQMDCTKCSYRVKCCPSCGTSLETENVIVGKIKSSTAETFDDWTKIKSQDECSSLSENNTPQDPNEYRIVVFGLPSSGVSATANTIVGDKLFQDDVTFGVTTKKCQMESRTRFGYVLKVVDTPGFVCDKKKRTTEELFPGLKQSIMLMPPGPHVVLLVLPLNRLNEDIHHMIHCLKCFENLSRHVIVILTKIDETEHDRAELKNKIYESENFSELLEFCGKRVVLFDNTSKSETQARELLDAVIKVVDGNMSKCFTTDYFSQETNKRLERVLQDYENSKKSVSERFLGSFGFGK